MKILFLTEGGCDIGLGHVTRCIAVAKAIRDIDPGIEIKFVVKGEPQIQNFIEDSSLSPMIFDWCSQREQAYELASNSDATVVDSYIADKCLYDVLSERTSGKLLMFDDYKRLDYPAGIVVNPSVYGNEIDYPVNKAITYFLGRDYIILAQEFRDVPNKKINEQLKNILVTLGGSGSYGIFLDELISFLDNRFDFTLNVVDIRSKRIDLAKMLDFMLEADLCISGGGQTINELLLVGLPAIGICLADNQLLNLEWMHRARCIEYVGWYNDNRVKERLAEAVTRVSYYKERKRLSDIGKQITDGKGALKIAEAALGIKCQT